MSVTTISAAPARRAAMATSAPIGPLPLTRMRLPISEPARLVACSATASGSAIAASCSDIALGNRMRLAFAADEDLAKRSLHMREAHRAAVEAHVEALVLKTFEAVAAAIARHARIDRDAVSDLDPRGVRPDRFDDAGDLVAEDHRLAQAHDAEAAVVVIVEIRAANSAEADPDAYVMRSELRRRRRPRPEDPWRRGRRLHACGLLLAIRRPASEVGVRRSEPPDCPARASPSPCGFRPCRSTGAAARSHS